MVCDRLTKERNGGNMICRPANKSGPVAQPNDSTLVIGRTLARICSVLKEAIMQTWTERTQLIERIRLPRTENTKLRVRHPLHFCVRSVIDTKTMAFITRWIKAAQFSCLRQATSKCLPEDGCSLLRQKQSI